jgi:hypothetical protein
MGHNTKSSPDVRTLLEEPPILQLYKTQNNLKANPAMLFPDPYEGNALMIWDRICGFPQTQSASTEKYRCY